MPAKRLGANATAIAATIRALVEAGKLDLAADAARIATAKSLALAVDVAPGNASLWRVYRAAEAELHREREGRTDGDTDNAAALSAPVVDGKDTRTAHSRTRYRRGGG